jgi:hypothetical protein
MRHPGLNPLHVSRMCAAPPIRSARDFRLGACLPHPTSSIPLWMSRMFHTQPPRPSVTRRPRFDSRRVSHMCHRLPAHRDATFYSERVRHAHPIRLPTVCRVCVPPPSGPLMEKAVTNPTCPPASGGHHCGASPPPPNGDRNCYRTAYSVPVNNHLCNPAWNPTCTASCRP